MKALLVSAASAALALSLTLIPTSTFASVDGSKVADVYGGKCYKRIDYTCGADGGGKCTPTDCDRAALGDGNMVRFYPVSAAIWCSTDKSTDCGFVVNQKKCIDVIGDPIPTGM